VYAVAVLALLSVGLASAPPSPVSGVPRLALARAPADAPLADEATLRPGEAPTAARARADTPAPAPKARLALAHGVAVSATVATAVLAVLAASVVPSQCYEAEGQPDPVCSAQGLMLGAALQVGLALAVVPEVYRLANDASGAGDIRAARASAWKWARWPALAGLIFVSTYLVGAAVEKQHYGDGQAAMLAGVLGTLASWITFDVLTVVGASAGYKESRRAQP